MLSVLALLALAIGLSVAVPAARREVEQEREAQLRAILAEYRNGVQRFSRRWNRAPVSLEELLLDAHGVPSVRRRYRDPYTGRDAWGWDVTGGSPRVHSLGSATLPSGRPVRDL